MGRVCGLGRGNPEVEVGETGALQSAKVPAFFPSSFSMPLVCLVDFAAEMISFFEGFGREEYDCMQQMLFQTPNNFRFDLNIMA